MRNTKIAIIGAGPAGISAAIQLRRYEHEFILFEKNKIGGLLWNANLIENYPGFSKGISGPRLIRLLEGHLASLKIDVTYSSIEKILIDNGKFVLESKQDTYLSDFVIVATGTKPKRIDLPIPESTQGRFHWDIINLLDAVGKKIIIIGAGDAAFDLALNLARKNQITIINRGIRIKSLPLLSEKAFNCETIIYKSNVKINNISLIHSKDREEKILVDLTYSSQNSNIQLECDDIVMAIGREPQLDVLDKIELNNKCILAGDVKNGIYRQVSIAVGDGIRAAMEIHNTINNEEFDESICGNR
jgi:thioredoxin reductase (NADPH)